MIDVYSLTKDCVYGYSRVLDDACRKAVELHEPQLAMWTLRDQTGAVIMHRYIAITVAPMRIYTASRLDDLPPWLRAVFDSRPIVDHELKP